MADEIVYSGSDLKVAAVIEQGIITKLSELLVLRGSPAIVDFSPMANRGSLTLSIPLAGWDADSMTAPGENTAVANTALDTDVVTLTLARQSMQRTITDELVLSSPAALVDMIVMSIVSGYANRFNGMLTALFSGVTASAGSSGVDLTLDDVMDATQTLMRANNTDGLYCMLHGQQMSDLQNSLRGEGGALSFSAPTAEMIAAKGKGYAGSYLGVDFWINPKVATANTGADRAGCMWSRGAFGFAEAPNPRANVLGSPDNRLVSPISIEFSRDASKGATTTIGNAFLGFAMIEDARAVKIVTDA